MAPNPAAPYQAARDLLQRHFGYPDFRPAQRPVIRSVLAGRDTLAVLPTGGGKSICFQVPALALGGATIVVSPLISLMQDQVAAACARGIPAAALHSALPAAEQRRILAGLESGVPGLLYLSPERLSALAPRLQAAGIRPRLLAIDEAHCIAEWGHDFRPAYRTLGAIRRRLGRPPVVALTGSATPVVRRDIMRALGPPRARWDVHIGSFDRRNLWFGVRRVGSDRDRLAALLELLREDDRVAIVYTPTRSVTEAVSWRLRQAGFRAAPYHAGLSAVARRETLEAFLDDQLEIVVATCAFGMGIDKPTVRLVVHWTMPATPESYYQEAGRAGRDGRFARCVLLYRPDDAELPRRQLSVTFPDRKLLQRIWSGDTAGVPRPVLESASRLAHELRPDRGPVRWEAVQRRLREAGARIDAMRDYAQTRRCRRAALVGYFGERLAACAGCDRCRAAAPPTAELPAPVRQRLRRLRSAVADRRHPGGGSLLDPVTVVRLAARPPATLGALADIPGVGPALAASLGRTLLEALHGGAPTGSATEPGSPLEAALARWRRETARLSALPEILVLSDQALRRLAAQPPTDREGLIRAAVLGPAALRAWGDGLLAVLTGVYSGDSRGFVPPPEVSNAEICSNG